MKKILFVLGLNLLSSMTFSQWQGKEYVVEEDPEVLQKLDEWQDLKLGFFVHWGAYSVEGLCESWPVVSEDVDWLTPHADIKKFRDHYFNELPKRFNPTKFNPGQWADLAEDMGPNISYLQRSTTMVLRCGIQNSLIIKSPTQSIRLLLRSTPM